MFDKITTKPTVAAKCSRCGAPEAAGDVWGAAVCYACFSDWMADERFSSGVINAHLGVSNRPEDFTKENHARYCAEAKKRTHAWAAERRTARAA